MDIENQAHPKGQVVYIQKENKKSSNYFFQMIGIFIMYSALIGSAATTSKLVYEIVVKKDIKSVYILGALLLHSIYVAEPSPLLHKILSKLDLQNWFDNYSIVCEEQIDKKGVLFPWMPHGIMSYPAHFSRYNKNSPFYNSVLCGSRAAVQLPVVGSFLQWNGLQGANPDNFKKIMKTRQNISFVPGGFEEATVTSDQEYRLIISDRKGFIKYALQFGYKVHPVFVFNENKGYKTTDFLMDFRMKLNKMKMPGTLFWSKYGIFPERHIDVTVVVGKKVQMPLISNPQKEDVDKYHAIYMEEVVKLFDRNVEKYDKGAKLKLWGEHKPRL